MSVHSISEGVLAIGQNFRALRKLAGLSQKEVSVFLGVSYQQVQKYERGENRFPVEKLFRLRQLYGISYEDFFTGLSDHRGDLALPDQARLFQRLNTLKDVGLRQKAFKIMDVLLDDAA